MNNNFDARGIPTAECPTCSGRTFFAKIQIDPEDYEIGMYFLDGQCSNCGTLITIPTPLDHPRNIK